MKTPFRVTSRESLREVKLTVNWEITGARDMSGDLAKLTVARRHIAHHSLGPAISKARASPILIRSDAR